MSEEEKIKRFGYRQARKNRIKALTVMLLIFVALTIIFSSIAIAFNKTYYVNYTETSSVKYGVHLKDNNFYEEDYLDEGFAYIASLIDKVETSFKYGILMDTSKDVEFKYTYRIDSVLQIKDRGTGKLLYAPVYNEFAESSGIIAGRDVNLKQTVQIDYEKYDQLAKSFISTYQLRDVDASLQVQMHVNVVGASEEFHASENANTYVSSISIPLATSTLSINITSAPPANNQKILSYTTAGVALVFRNTAFALGAVALLVGLALLIYTYVSRNHDITYDIKVKRLLSAYKSFIQRVKNEFDTSGCQVMCLMTFNELLEIRDTIQSPILMFENADRTRSSFFIPTCSNLVYLFEIKVEDYDEIYDKAEGDEGESAEEEPAIKEPAIKEPAVEEPAVEKPAVEEPAVEEPAVEEPAVEEPAVEEPAVEEPAIEEPAVEEPAVEEEPESVPESIFDHIVEIEDESDDDFAIAYVDEAGSIIKVTCTRSFTANLIQSNKQVKYYYNEIKNKILSYMGTKSRISWRVESFNKGRIQLFKMKIRGKTICLYCALDPTDLDRNKYFHEQATAKAFAKVPTMVRIKSDRSLNRAKTLIERVMVVFGIEENPKAAEIDYTADYPYDSTKSLVERKLIKLLFPDATAAEPKPHHHVHSKTFEVLNGDEVDEIVIFEAEEISEAEMSEIIELSIPELESIDYDETDDTAEVFIETEENPGVEVIGVVWPEKAKKNKIYKYDPDGETVSVGDVVIVPTRDIHRNCEVIRKAAVAHANYKIDPSALLHPLKKIAGVVHRKKISDTNSKDN